MKKLFFTIFILPFCLACFGQTILNSHPLDLRNSAKNHQILTAVNSQKQLFVFTTDKENTKALKYNNYIFLLDSINTNRPNKDFEYLSGYGFDKNGNPLLYWSSENYNKILSVWYDFKNKTNKVKEYTISLKNEIILKTFSHNDAFYILTGIEKQNILKFYRFSEGNYTENSVDFSSYKFTNEKGNPQTFNEQISQNNLDLIDTKFLNPLIETVGNSKMYLEKNNCFLTFESFTQTQIFQINLDDFSISQQLFPQQILAKASGKSNSYLQDNTLYQIKANKEELAIAATDLKSEELIQKYYANSKDTISFRNSPLFSQTGNQKIKIIKNSKKFIQRLNASQIGLSVYKTPSSNIITVGGIRNVNTTGAILLGVTASVAVMAIGDGGDIGPFFDEGSVQSTFFEGVFNTKFELIEETQNALATELIANFLSENKVTLQNIFPFENYFILSYYDAKKKEFVMRKFQDISF